LNWSSVLLNDKTQDEAERRQLEAAAKAQANEIAKIAPKVKLMKFMYKKAWIGDGFAVLLLLSVWFLNVMANVITWFVMNEQARKTQIHTDKI
jgi:hypothetical protein